QAVWAPGQVAERMIAALEAASRPVPPYLREAAYELRDRLPGRAVVATHCYWEGEGCIGRVEGVVATRAVWLEGREAVEVTFDRERTDYTKLLRSVQHSGCAHPAFVAGAGERAAAAAVFGDAVILSTGRPGPAGDTDQKRHLRRSPFRDLALSELQAVRVNAALWAREDPAAWLSPRQRARGVAQ
ncbi:MAG: VPGUxxT family thioredoxin-like (seleno)protein, type 2, partial [Myxococcota bacterium]